MPATSADSLTVVRLGDITVVTTVSGRWCVALGPSFPVGGGGLPRPHDGAVFWRTDLTAQYVWGEAAQAWTLVSSGSGAPTDAEYIVSALSASLSAERLLTDTATVTWDFATPSAVKATVPAGVVSPAAHTHAEADVTNLVTDLAAKAPTARTIGTTAPLTGGGDLSANRTLAVSAATTAAAGVVQLATDGQVAASVAVQGNDARMSNARTPTAHATTHQPGGTDAMAVDAVAATGSLRTLGAGAAQACAGTDSRLSDARVPTAHHATHEPGGSDPMAVDAVAATGALRTIGTGAAQACGGADSRLSDARTPSAHAATHLDAGTDPFRIPPNQLPAPIRVTLTSADRATLASTARLGVYDLDPPLLSTYMPTAFTVQPDEYVLQYRRLHMRDNTRATLNGNAEIVLTSLAPVGRLVLSGAGGGN